MKVFWCPQTRSTRVLWLLDESGLAYEPILIDIRDHTKPRDSEFSHASPLGKVPAIVDGEVKMWDSSAIGLYIADKGEPGKLAPPIGDPKRAAYYYWMVFTPGMIEPAMSEKASGLEPNPMQRGYGSFDLMIDLLEKGVGNSDWLLGDQFSAADVMVGATAHFLKQFGMLPENKTIEAYIDRCHARPAFQKALAMG